MQLNNVKVNSRAIYQFKDLSSTTLWRDKMNKGNDFIAVRSEDNLYIVFHSDSDIPKIEKHEPEDLLGDNFHIFEVQDFKVDSVSFLSIE